MAARARTARQPDATGSRSTLKSELRPLVQAVALMLLAGASAHVQAAGIMNLGAATPRASGGAAGAGGAPGMPNLGVSPQQALQASQPSIRNLGYAAHAIAAQIAAQQNAAAAAAKLPSTVPNGLAPGGLQVANGVTFVTDNNGNPISQNTDAGNPLLWVNANGPKQTVDGSGHVNVDVKQTGQNAVLTWETMNVGRQTTLNFDQSAGTQTNGANNWAVLNRINDPSGRPSQILGNITAQGAVYVINRNGVLFGAGSQVNVHSLVASSLNLLDMKNQLVPTPAGIVASNQQFLSLPAGTTGGLAYPESGSSGGTVGAGGKPNEVLGLGSQALLIGTYQAPGDVTIEQGASITTHTNGTASDGGFVLVAAPNVTNAGSISATSGQVVLAAGVGVSLRPNGAGATGNPQVLLPELSGQIVTTDLQTGGTIDVTPAGTLTNTGIVQASRGNVNLLGSRVAQNGVVGVTTSVNTPGTITISTADEYASNNPLGNPYTGTVPVTGGTGGGDNVNRAGLLSFGPGSVTTVLPDNNGQTATSTPGTTFTPGGITMSAGSVWFQGGSLIEAPGSNVSVTAYAPSIVSNKVPGQTAVPGRIYVDDGATIDVSGLANVQAPISQTLVTIDRIGQNELADSPLLRNSFLFGLKGVVVDSTLTGTRSDGVQWVGSPILNLSGYVNLIPRTVDQLLTNGGTITLSGNEVMTATGSSMNLNGGYVHYNGGMVNTTRLVDANGAIVPIGQASPYERYIGIAGQFVESHPRWGVTKSWFNPLQTGGTYQSDYIVGGNAGTLDLFASQALVLDGDISAQAFGGAKQMQGNSLPSGGTFNLGADPKLAGGALAGMTWNTGANPTMTFNGISGFAILQDNAPQLGALMPGFSIGTPIDKTAYQSLAANDPNNLLTTQIVPVAKLNSGSFANLNVSEDKNTGKGIVVAQGTQLNLQPGGSISLNSPAVGADVNVAGRLSAPSGSISITSGGNVVVGPQGAISAAGQWVNNDVQAAPGTTPGNSQFINGGSISLSAKQNSTFVDGVAVDATGSILLQPGSVLDVSSGGEMLANGQLLMQNGVPAGRGGNVTLQTYAASQATQQFGHTRDSGSPLPATQPVAGTIAMGGTILSEGFSGGGTLTLEALGFRIGGDRAAAAPWDVYLPENFFSQQGFGKYVLNAYYDSTVAPGAAVALTQLNRIPDALALQQTGSGANLSAGSLTTIGQLDAYHRQPTNLVLTGGSYVAWQNGPDGPPPSYPGVTGAVTLSSGASINADAGASIALASPKQVTVLGSVVAPGGAIVLSADTGGTTGQPGQFNVYTPSNSRSVWLGSDATLDVSGVALANPLAAPVKVGGTTVVPNSGKVLPGGSVTLSSDAGYVVAQTGSTIDVSGTSANFDRLQANGTYASQPVWSDAGSITLSAAYGLFADGTLAGHGGASQARGGTLAILPHQNSSSPGATALVVRQSGTLVPAGLAPGQDFSAAIDPTTGQPIGQPTGVIQFSADRLNGSGIANLVLGDSTPSPIPAPVPPIAFAGNVNLTLPESVTLNAGRIAAIGMDQLSTLLSTPAKPAGGSSVLADQLAQPPANPLGTTVTINAPYVALVGPIATSSTPAFAPVATLSDATLNVNASFLDLRNQIQLNNIGQANLASSGDIRLSSTSVATSGPAALAPGMLYTPGNVSFNAADVYPATGSTFIVDAVGPVDSTTGKPAPTTVTFGTTGSSGTPLSAGGTLLVDATNIVQGGNVRAPSGTLVFGVGDPTNAATQKQFGNLPLVATDSVTFANGSVTSVSNGGSTIPYGTTIDGVEWQFNPLAGTTASDLNAPPAKYIGVNGTSVALNKGATIDLSGGGDLQAAEWVPGTGGTRDVLSQYNVSYASGKGATAVPVNAGAGNVYAIVPGTQSPVAAYDPLFAQSVQPDVASNGTPTTKTVTLGVGQAGMNDAIGKAVYLSGVPGLAAGYYTLLPGKYATLPGAYRVTVSATTGNVVPGAAQVLPDGTVTTAGYFADAVTGGRSATPTLFNVQSGAVWQQYSQYTLKGANDFFTAQAAKQGNVTPPLPVDAGQLVLAATKALTLGATLNAVAGAGGAPAEVDIASRDIQITGNGSAALPGYLQIGGDALDSLTAGSLLIGGTRAATTKGVTITPIANSVVVSNDANTSLKGPEILLVTKTDASGTDSNAANGLRVDAGASIVAAGDYPAAKDQPITIAGDGALLRVSNGAMAPLTRTGGTGTGLLTVGAGATLSGGQALMLDSSGNLKVDPSAVLSAKAITADGSAITFTNATGAAAANLPGFVIDQAGLAQLSNADLVTLRSYGAMGFIGDVNATFGKSVDLSAGTFTSDGGRVTLNGQQIAFTNETGAPNGTVTPGNGTLTVNAKEIDFGTGTKALSGFSSANMTASGGIVGQGTGTFDFGALPVTLNAPVYLADTSSASTVKTTGALTLNGAAGTALAKTPVGGAWHFVGGTLADNGATIAAPAGNVSLEATTGNLTIGSGSTVSAAGVSKQFFDVTQYAPAGSIILTADAGTVDVQSGTTLDFSGAKGGGAAGSLTLSAPKQVVNLNGTIKGGATNGYAGGSLSLDTAGAADLDSLAKTLASSGVNQSIAVHTKSGNLTLSAGNALTARSVSLTADGGAGNASDTANGNVNVLGTIDASGKAGGQIDLYGRSGVDVEGTLLARGSDPTQRGGKVNIGTSAVFDPTVANPYNATYGYENIDPSRSGLIRVGADALIDVSGGTAGGLSGGTVNFRAPLLADGSVDVQLPNTFNSGKGIVGSRATTLEAYATWSTTDATSGAQHFDGIVDPAGWYDSKGHLLGGTFTAQGANPPTFTFAPNANGDGGGTLTNNATGAQVTLTGSDADQASLYNGVTSIGFPGMSSTYFVPTTANADHQNFYGGQIVKASDGTLSMTPGTLMGFIQSGLGANGPTLQGSTGNIANFRVAPGIEFDNPSTAINSGNISILSNWNLGAGLPNNSGTIDPAYRYNRTIAPMLTFRATNNFDAKASITDGFFQSQVATILGAAGTGSATGTYAAALALYNSLMSLDDPASISVQFTDGSTQSLTSISKDSTNPLYDPNVALTAPLQNQAPLYYSDYLEYGNSWGSYYGYWASGNYAFHIMPYVPLRIPAPVLSNYASYQDYANAYFGPGSWLFGYASNTVAGVVRNGVVFFEKFGTPTPPVMSSKPGDYGQYIALYGNYLSRLTFTKSPNFAFVDPRNAYSFFYAPASPLSIPNTGVNIGALPGNTAANVATKDNPLPISYAALLGGQSTSYRIVGGADLASANPLAVQPNAALDSASVSAGNVTLNQHTAYVDSNGLTLLQPTTIRTGTGSIDIAAANDFTLADTVAPGVVYTAGAPAQGSPTLGLASAVMNGGVGKADILVTPAVNPDSAGDISIRVQGDINGLQNVTDATGAVTGGAGNSISQYWWQWMQITAAKTAAGNVAILAPLTRSSIDFGAFDQGVMSVGGNVSISAGGNISDLAVSLPTTWYLDGKGKPVTVGGGNLAVRAGADILSGDYFVAKGTGTISAGGSIGSDITTASRALGWTPMAVSTVLAAQDGVFDVVARQGVDIGAVLNPSYASSYTQSGGQPTPVVTLANYGQYPDGQGYSPTSAVNVISTTGDVRLGTLGDMWTGANGVLPGSVNLTAFSGAIDIQSGGALYPSAVGQLNLVADQSVYLSNAAAKRTNATLPNTFGLSDADPLQMPSPTNPQVQVAIPALTDVTFAGHATSALHRDDTQPVRIYGLNGSIVNGTVDTSAASDGFYSNLVTLSVDKPALVQAGQDIVNLAFWGQNLRSSDVTRVVAGRDIYDTPIPDTGGGAVPVLVIGGPGWFDVQAGRNIGPLTSRAELYNQQAIPTGVPLFTGIDAVGNANNPNLPRESANVNVLFGVGPGVDLPGFISTYIAPGSSVAGVPSATPALVAFMEQYDAGALGVDTGLQADKDAALARVGRLTADDAWKQFKALPSYVQQLFAEKVLFGVLAQVGADFNDPASRYNGQYSRGYQAINTLFPASFGYTANNLGGGSNGANKSASTGNLDIRSTTIQTQQGGDVTILGPGGQALVGSTMAPPQIVDANGKVVAGPGTMGILTLEKGNVDIFTDQSVLLAQSRIFTEQGGDMTIWSSNGDINAGKGAKTSADTPAPQYVCDANHYCTVDSRGQVTGAGIATLQSIPGAPKGTVNLIAPRGTVDAGDAGIRAGNLNVAALRVVNADNIQVTGKATGIPLVQAVNTGALTAASSAASAASQVAQDIARNNASGVAPRRWTISVQVEGFGDNGPDGGSKRRKSEQIGYDSSNSVSLLGFGATGPTQRTLLSKDELGKLNRF